MQNCSSALLTVLNSTTLDLVKGDLFEFYPPDETELFPGNAEKRFAGTEVIWFGWRYERQAITRGRISKYINEKFNNVSITLSNVDRTISTWLASIDLDGYRCVIRTVSRSVDDDSIVLMVGRCGKPRKIDNRTIQISITQDLGSTENELPWQVFTPNCPLKFKGPECLGGQALASKSATYQAATACNKSEAQCREYSNYPAFQGTRFNTVTGTFKVSQRRGGAGGAFLSLVGLGNKRVKRQYSSQDSTPYGKAVPMGMGRTQIELLPIRYADTGEYLAGQWIVGAGEIAKILDARNVSAGWATVFQAYAEHVGKYGWDSSQAPTGFFGDQGSDERHSHRAYIEVTIKGDNPDTGDIAPTIVAVILWNKIPVFDESCFTGDDWSDNPVEQIRLLLTDPRGLNYNSAWINNTVAARTARICNKPLIDQTGAEDVYVATSAGTPGVDYKRYRSTGILDTQHFRKVLGLTSTYPAAREVAYNTYSAASPPTNLTPGTYYRRQWTSNWHLTDRIKIADFLFKDLLPCFRGYLITGADGRLQIRTEEPAITSYLRNAISAADTTLAIEDAVAWKELEIPVIYALIGVNEVTSETRIVSSIDFSTAGNSITLSSSGSGSLTVTASGATLSGGTTSIQAQGYVTVGGTPATGNTATITIDGVPITYTLNVDDATGTVAAMLSTMINADQTLNRYVEAIWTATLPNQVLIRSKLGTLNLSAGVEFAHAQLEIVAHVHMPFCDSAFGALTEGNILKDSHEYPMGDRQSSYNQFEVNYSEAVQDFQPTRLLENDYDHQDRVNNTKTLRISGDCVDNYHQANRLVLAARYKFREGDYFNGWASPPGPYLLLEEGDIVCMTHDDMPGKRNLMLRIEELTIDPDHQVSIVGRLYADEQFPQTAQQRTVQLTSGIGWPTAVPGAVTNLILTEIASGTVRGTFTFASLVGSQTARIEARRTGEPDFSDTGIRVTPDSLNQGTFEIAGVSGVIYVRVIPYSAAGEGPSTQATYPPYEAMIMASSSVTATGQANVVRAYIDGSSSVVATGQSDSPPSVAIAGSSVVVAAPGVWDPTTVSGLKLWAAARLITGLSDSDPVTTWSDQSGQGNDLSQSTTGNKPLYKTNIVNGRPAILFDGVDDYFTLANVLSGASAGEVFIVIKAAADPAVSSAKSGIWNMDGEGTNACHYPFTDGNIYDAWGSTARKSTGNPTPSLASWRIYNISSAAGAWTSRIDGVQHYTTATNTFSSFSGSPYLGRSASLFGDVYFNGHIAEILIFNEVLSAGDRTYVLNGLADIYGISV